MTDNLPNLFCTECIRDMFERERELTDEGTL